MTVIHHPAINATDGLDAECRRVVVDWNQTTRDYPRDRCLHHLFEEQVERSPEAVAIESEGVRLTYRMLNERANGLAHALKLRGVRRGDFVGLMIARSPEFVALVLGILKAGAAYLPIPTDSPPARLRLVLRGARPRLVVIRGGTAVIRANGDSVCWVDWTELESAGTPGARDNPGMTLDACDPAYVMSTSGSTGEPNGVVVPHRAVTRLVFANDYLPFDEHQVFLLLASTVFDASTLELWGALLHGAKLVVYPEGPLDFAQLGKAIKAHGVSCLWLTSALFNVLIDRRPETLEPVRHLLVGGEALSLRHVRRALARLPGTRIINGYGPTEGTTFTTTFVINDKLTDDMQSVPIGRPLANTRVYVLDPARRPVPVGRAGELYVGGDGLAVGYLNQSVLTAERFVADCISGDPKARLYRTGDLVRWRADGNIEYLGRLDRQVKICGFRIELGEIESVLANHPGVAACAVVARDVDGDKSLVAWVVWQAGTSPKLEAIREWLGERLPGYMIPAHYYTLSGLPLAANGKVDRQALERGDGVELALSGNHVPARTDIESGLVEIWQGLLGRESVGVRDRFLDLGGHSLLAAIVAARVLERFLVEAPLRWMYEHPTIEALASKLESQRTTTKAVSLIGKADRDQPLEMSSAQRRMWVLHKMLPDPATYNEPVAMQVVGRIDLGRVRRAFQALLERHEILRTALVEEEGRLVQRILGPDEVSLAWRETDLALVPAGGNEAALEEQMVEEARRPFELTRAPLWRVHCFKRSDQDHAVELVFHHSIVDEWSMRLFLREWEQLYNAADSAKAAPPTASTLQYADYAAWEWRRLTGERQEQQRSFWRGQLENLPPALELPLARVRPALGSGKGAVHRFQVSGPVTARLREVARAEGATVFATLLAAFHVWLHRMSGQDDVVVATPFADRERPEVQSLLGFFLNTLPIRLRLDAGASFRQVLGQMRESLVAAFGHAELPFDQMVEKAGKQREPGQRGLTPLHQVMFFLVEEGLPDLLLGEAQARPMPVTTGTSKCDLTLIMLADSRAGEEWECQLEYSLDLYTPEVVVRMAGYFVELLQSIAAQPELPIGKLNLLPEVERQRILADWNQTARDYPGDKCLHQLFEEQVERTPEAVAVEFEGQGLTYRELNIRSERLARRLRSMRVGPDVLVGVCIERSFEMLVGLLGILKAGGAYVPIDPNYPLERIAFMLDDAGAEVLLTQRSLAAHLASWRGAMLMLDEDLEPVEGERTNELGKEVTPSHLAYVIYTSGSTGQPKGVEISHAALVNFLSSMRQEPGLSAHDVVLAVTTICFDISGLELFLPLIVGAKVALVSRATASDGMALWTELDRVGATVLQATPATWRLLLTAGWTGRLRLKALVGGEAVPRPLVNQLVPRCHQVWNMYGPTETTIWSATARLDAGEGPVVIGRPIANTSMYIVDESMQLQPVGVPGELLIGGHGLARGYLHRPELTHERFIANPFGEGRVYRTGDTARWRDDGTIECLGRRDFQVKLRGFRIELGEIESILADAMAVRQAVVVVREEQLVAYLVLSGAEPLDVAGLRKHLGGKLPDYMIPARYVALPALPLTPNGKIDRITLAQDQSDPLSASVAHTAPRNETEHALVRIWQTVLGLDQVGIHDTFFSLGGHSLMAARMFGAIEQETGIRLPLALLIQAPTIADLSRHLREGSWTPFWSSLVPIQPKGSNAPLFLVHGGRGNVIGLRPLAAYLGDDQPVYGLQAVGLDARTAPLKSIEEMATHYLREVLSVRPEGLVHLGGVSMGGMIAFEMAHQLRSMGRDVGLILVLDTVPPGESSVLPWTGRLQHRIAVLAWRANQQWQKILTMPVHERPFRVIGKVGAILRRALGGVFAPAQRAELVNVSPSVALPDELAEHNHLVYKCYVPKPFPGTVVVVRARENPYPIRRLLAPIWTHLALGGTEFIDVDGTHGSFIKEPFVRVLGEKLRTRLNAANRTAR